MPSERVRRQKPGEGLQTLVITLRTRTLTMPLVIRKDKLIFVRHDHPKSGAGTIDYPEWYFLITGGVVVENPHKNQPENAMKNLGDCAD